MLSSHKCFPFAALHGTNLSDKHIHIEDIKETQQRGKINSGTSGIHVDITFELSIIFDTTELTKYKILLEWK